MYFFPYASLPLPAKMMLAATTLFLNAGIMPVVFIYLFRVARGWWRCFGKRPGTAGVVQITQVCFQEEHSHSLLHVDQDQYHCFYVCDICNSSEDLVLFIETQSQVKTNKCVVLSHHILDLIVSLHLRG